MSVKDYIVKKGYGITEKLGSCNDSQIATAFLACFKLFFIPLATAMDDKATTDQKIYAGSRDFLTEAIALGTYIGITGMAQRYLTLPLSLGYYKNKVKLLREGKIPGVDISKITDEDFKALENIDKKSFESVMLDSCFRPKGKGKATLEEKQYMEKLTSIVKKIQDVSPADPIRPPGIKNAKGIKKVGAWFKNTIESTRYDFKNLLNKNLKIQFPEKLCKNVKLNISQMCIWTLAVFVIPPMCNALLKPVLEQVKSYLDKKAAKKIDVEKKAVQMNEIKKPDNQTAKNTNFGNYYRVGNLGNMRVGM